MTFGKMTGKGHVTLPTGELAPRSRLDNLTTASLNNLRARQDTLHTFGTISGDRPKSAAS